MDEFERAVGSLDQFSVGKALLSLDQNPDDGARSLQLAKATGAPPTLVHGDLENFEQGYKAKLTSDIIGNNETVAHYVMHHPLADVVSNDDYGNLDNFTKSVPAMPWVRRGLEELDQSTGVTWLIAAQAGVERAAQKTYEAVTAEPQVEPGSTYVPYLSAIGDITNRAFAAFLAPITGFFSGFAEEAVRQAVDDPTAKVIGYSAEREAESFMQAIPGFGGHAMEVAHGAFRMREVQAASDAQAFRDAAVAHTDALNKARPYIDIGQEPPVGLHPIIDQAKAFHNAEYIAQLGEHLAAAQASLTKERNPDYFQWIADRVNKDHTISIDGDVVAQLYGDKLPAPDDGLLGWVPNIEQKLELARDSGTRVSIPTGALVARMDPALFQQLSPFMRAWEGGLSAEEAKVPWEYKPTVDGALPIERKARGLEPLFGIGDRKLNLQFRTKSFDYDIYHFIDQDGKMVGDLEILPQPDDPQGSSLYVGNINGMAGLYSNSFGPALIRDLKKQLKAIYPDFEWITGHRVSGAREAAGTWEDEAIAHPRVRLDLENELPADHANFHSIMEQSYGQGITATPIPSQLLSGKLAEISQIVREEVARITGTAPELVAGIKYPGIGEGQAIHGAFVDGKILADLFGPDPVGFARHESIHYLRRSGLLTDGEWAALVKASRDEGWIQRYNIDDRYADLGLDELQKHEEAIAEAFRDWAKNREGQPKTEVTGFFEKLQQLWESIKERLSQLFEREVTADELFTGIQRGDFAGAGEGGEVAFAKSKAPDNAIQTQLDQLRANSLGLDAKTYKNIQAMLQERYAADLAASLKRAERDQKATQTRAWKAEAEVIRKDVDFTIIRRPDVMADQFIGAGKLIGEQLPSYRYSIKEGDLSPEQRALLPRHYYRAEGLPADYVARILGIPDGATMINLLTKLHSDYPEMTANERLIAAAKAETDRRMQEKFGDLQKNIMLDAQDQAMMENDVNLVMEEWQAIAMQNGGGPIDKDFVKAKAQADFLKRQQIDVTYPAALRAVGDLSKKAHDFLANGDSASALIALQRRAEAMVQAIEAKKLDKLRTQFEKIAKQSNKQFNEGYTATIDPTHNLFAQQILNQLGMRTRRSMDDIAQFTYDRGFDSLKAFSEAAARDGKEMPIWDQLFDRGWKKDVKALTVEEFQAAANSVRSIIHNGKEDLKFERMKDAESGETIKQGLIRAIADSAGDKVYAKEGKSTLRSYYVANLQMENILNRWDGFDSKGLWNQEIMRDMIDSNNRADAVKKEFAERLSALVNPDNLKATVPNQLFFDQDKGTPLALQRKNLLAVMLNMGTESNFDKLAKGYGVTRPAIEAWVDEHATARDWGFVQGVWKLFAELKARSDTMYQNLTGGVEAANIPSRVVPTKFGAVAGGYYPVIWHPDMVGGERLGSAKAGLFSNDYTRASVPAGYTKARIESIAKPMDLNLDRMPARLAEEIHDIEMRPAILNAARVFYDKEVLSAVRKHWGDEYKDLMQPYLESVANSSVRNSKAMALMDSWSEFLRQNTIAALIGFNPITVLKHGPTALVLSAKEVGPKAFTKAFAETVPSEFLRWTKSLVGMDDRTAETNWQFAMKNSFELQRRDRNWMESLYGSASGLIEPGDTYTPFRQRVMQWGAKPVALSDMISAVPTWMAKYNDELGKGSTHGEAVSEADRAVRRAHGSTASTGRTAFQRDANPWLTSVYNFFSDVMNRQMETIWKAGVDAREAKAEGKSRAMAVVPGLTAGMFTYLMWPALVEYAATEGTGGAGVANEDDPYWWIGAKQLGFAAASSWPLVREVSAAMAFGREPQYGLTGTALGIGFNAARDLWKAYNDIKDSGELDDVHAAKMIQDASLFVGMFTGFPGGMTGKVGKFLWNVKTGEEEPQNPWEWVKGVTHGKIRR